jgi:signal transduction histidine kinase
MRSLFPVTAGFLVILLLSVFYALGSVADEARFDRALSTLDALVMDESQLRLDVLSARDDDPQASGSLDQEVAGVHNAIAKLRSSRGYSGAVGRLEVLAAQQDPLIGQFEGYNGSLRRSLVGLAGGAKSNGRVDGRSGPTMAELALDASVLRLEVNTSPAAEDNVADSLRKLGADAVHGDPQAAATLLREGESVRNLLPQMGATVRALSALPWPQEENAARSDFHRVRQAARASSARYRLFLYAAAIFLLVLLIDFALQLRRHIQALKRRIDFEHIMGELSLDFVGLGAEGVERCVQRALAELGRRVGSNRAYYVRSDPVPRCYCWSDARGAWPLNWPASAQTLASRSDLPSASTVFVPDIRDLPGGVLKHSLESLGIRGWISISSNDPGPRNLLGFDGVDAALTWPRQEVALLRLAFDTIENAIGRASVEREREILGSALRQARRMETIGVLACGVAHNFNNIICSILGYTEMQEAEVVDGSRMADLVIGIRQAAERARDVVNQILNFGRRHDLSRHRVSVKTLMSEAQALLGVSLKSNVKLVIANVADGIMVCGEQAQLQQVIMNLCKNAIQAIDQAGTVRVVTETHSISETLNLTHGRLSSGQFVRITISDDGRGMEASTLARVFEPFFTTRPDGHGLGLAMTLEVVRGYGGAINVRSEENKGTIFEVWLRRTYATDAGNRSRVDTGLGQGETVMVVNCDPISLQRDEEVVATLGYEPVGFSDPTKASTALTAAPRRFDALLIVNIQPPSVALDLALSLHKLDAGLPIILATAMGSKLTATHSNSGVRAVVGAPIEAFALASTLSQLFRPDGAS